ncbi:polyprenyl diphosphate synthase [Microgenomates group bacterium]|nr:polyprenyl diphosphate synthase [Microgenomates group bacterium]
MNLPDNLHHLAIICDGNRRWARAKGLPPIAGHTYAVNKTGPKLITHLSKLGLPYLTVWLFSTENWHRSQEEVSGLMQLFRSFGVAKLTQEANKLNLRLRFIGRLTDFDPDLQDIFRSLTANTKNNTGMTVTAAMSYGGHDELTRTFQKVLASHPRLTPQKITPDLIAKHLDTAGIPDIDILLRPGGEQRLSGFLPWQSTYAELFFPPEYFPDLTPAKIDEVIAHFAKRERRFGK